MPDQQGDGRKGRKTELNSCVIALLLRSLSEFKLGFTFLCRN